MNGKEAEARKFKDELEKADPSMKIKSIIDYDANYILVSIDTDKIPGIMYKVNKKTGKTEDYFPQADMDNFLNISDDKVVIF